jgi:hypothetical protein
MENNKVMELIGHVKNGVVVLDGGATLPEGAEVRVLTNGQIPRKHASQEYEAVTNDLLDRLQEEEDIAKYGRHFRDMK